VSIGSIDVLTVILLVVIFGQRIFSGLFSSPAIQAWATIFVAIVVQATPFLVLGVVVSAGIATFVPQSMLDRALPKRPSLAVPVAGVAGVVLPGCECASVPVAGGLIARGVTPGAALAFLLSAPAINPVVLVSTAVAFPGRPAMVLGRFIASLAVAVVMGLLWTRFGRSEWMKPPRRADVSGMRKWAAFRVSARYDFIHAGGFLVLGAIMAATLNVVVPQQWLKAASDNPIISIVILGALAVLLAICSEADAFVAASLSSFSLTSRLVFLVVGPTVDVKLVALQTGTFGRAFAIRFAPATFVVGVLVSVLVGWWLL
jgi:uncharacterized membrane protein YraQ (UPF0718 family)